LWDGTIWPDFDGYISDGCQVTSMELGRVIFDVTGISTI
jgi:hypothetical protein